MGVETDYIAAEDKDLDEILSSANPIEKFGGVYGKGTDPVSLSTLFCTATGQEFDPSLIDQFEPVRADDGFERMVLPVPENIRDFLATISEINVDDVLSTWKRTAEYELAGWDEKDARTFLIEIGAYANQSKHLPLYMWISV